MKTVSLAEALASGKKIRIKRNDKWLEVFQPLASDSFTMDQILHAECQIIEEPREFWIWDYNNGNYSLIIYATKEECIKDRKRLGDYSDEGRPVKFREVLDE